MYNCLGGRTRATASDAPAGWPARHSRTTTTTVAGTSGVAIPYQVEDSTIQDQIPYQDQSALGPGRQL